MKHKKKRQVSTNIFKVNICTIGKKEVPLSRHYSFCCITKSIVMKKIFIGMVALALCLGMNSCKKEAAPAEDKTTSTEQVSEAEGQADEAPSTTAAELLAKAKAEGANWSVDEWKAAFKDMLLISKPMMVELNDMLKDLKDEPTKALQKAKDIEEKYGDVEKIMDEFEKFAETTVNGKLVVDDEEWGKQLMEKLGIPNPD